jgi:hypothetical protein
MECHAVPEDVQRKLLAALEKAIAEKKGCDPPRRLDH